MRPAWTRGHLFAEDPLFPLLPSMEWLPSQFWTVLDTYRAIPCLCCFANFSYMVLGKEALCRVPMEKRSANSSTLGKNRFSCSDWTQLVFLSSADHHSVAHGHCSRSISRTSRKGKHLLMALICDDFTETCVNSGIVMLVSCRGYIYRWYLQRSLQLIHLPTCIYVFYDCLFSSHTFLSSHMHTWAQILHNTETGRETNWDTQREMVILQLYAKTGVTVYYNTLMFTDVSDEGSLFKAL